MDNTTCKVVHLILVKGSICLEQELGTRAKYRICQFYKSGVNFIEEESISSKRCQFHEKGVCVGFVIKQILFGGVHRKKKTKKNKIKWRVLIGLSLWYWAKMPNLCSGFITSSILISVICLPLICVPITPGNNQAAFCKKWAHSSTKKLKWLVGHPYSWHNYIKIEQDYFIERNYILITVISNRYFRYFLWIIVHKTSNIVQSV